MTAPRVPVVRTAGFCTLALFVASFAWPPGAPANPLPGLIGAAFHIQPAAPVDCQIDPIHDCGQITQQCPEIGALAVDVYLFPVIEADYPVEQRVFLDLRWDGDWTPLGFTSCVGGIPDLDPVNGGVQVRLDLPLPLLVTADPLRIGRLFLEADSPGRFNNSTTVLADEEPCAVIGAGAGETCYLILRCENWFYLCYTSFNPGLLALSAEEGGQASGSILATVQPTCATSFVEEEPWMSLSVVTLSGNQRRIDVTVDATDLPPGVHDGIIVAETEASHPCATVRVEVTPATQDVPAEEPLRLDSSWGRVKARYR